MEQYRDYGILSYVILLFYLQTKTKIKKKERKFMKSYRKNTEKINLKKSKSKFPQIVSILIIGTLAIMAFFHGGISQILLIIFWSSCGIYQLIKYIRSKNKNRSYKTKTNRYPHNRQRNSYGSHIHYRRNPYNGTHFRYYAKRQRNRRNYRNGQDEIV